MQQGQVREAIGSYERLVAASPEDFTGLNNLAWLYQEVGDERALDLARRARDRDPSHPEGSDTYGWVLLERGQTEEAVSVFQDAHKAHPGNTTIAYHLAVALDKADRRGEAAEILRRLLRDSPDFQYADEARKLLAELQ